jgi:hypothetical protein
VTPPVRQAVLALILLLVAWALMVAVTGGFDVRPYGIKFKSTDPNRAAYAALAMAALYIAAFRRHAIDHGRWLDRRAAPAMPVVARYGSHLALAVSIATCILAIVYGIHIAGGSDSYGYISQADLWLAGDLVKEQPISTQVPWPDADWTFAPLGYRPAQQRGAIVPVYAAGLPVLMAIGKSLFGTCGIYLVVPLLGGLTVLLTYWLGVQVWSPLVGILAMALMATSPTFLFMIMNPMSDVPVSALFLAALVVALSSWRSRALWAGVLVSMAIFVRPNLVPIGAVFLALILARASHGQRWRAFVWFGAGGLPLILVIAALNARLYGAPWAAGYGSLNELYGAQHLFVNLRQFSEWLALTETPVVLLAVVPLAALRRFDRTTRIALIGLALFIAAVWFAYLFYNPFDVWWYLRFLLPAFPAMFVMTGMGIAWLLARYRGSSAIAIVLLIPLFALRISTIREGGILRLWQGGVVYASAAEYVRKQLPANAVLVTVQHSGSIRYNGERLTMRWDLLDPAWWPRALDVLVERGYRPFLLISSFEEKQFRTQFHLSDAADAPGTIVARMDTPEIIRLYDPLRQLNAPPATIEFVVACPCTPGRPFRGPLTKPEVFTP